MSSQVIARDTLGNEKKKLNCRIAVYGSGVEFQQTEAKGTVLLENAEQLMNFSKGEEANMEQWVGGRTVHLLIVKPVPTNFSSNPLIQELNNPVHNYYILFQVLLHHRRSTMSS